ncbi:hypothetical protein ACVXZ4_16735 [Lacisediminihabitans sp. FW035]
MMTVPPVEPKDPRKPSVTRIWLWIGVAGVGLYSIVQGVLGIMRHG